MDINHVLGELYKLLAADKISPRRGAVMAYTCSLLLRTLPAINEELEPEGPEIIIDIPRPKRDDPVDSERALIEKMAARRVTTPVEPDAYDGWTSPNPNDAPPKTKRPG